MTEVSKHLNTTAVSTDRRRSKKPLNTAISADRRSSEQYAVGRAINSNNNTKSVPRMEVLNIEASA